MKKLIIELSDERPITPSSLFLVGQLLGKSRFIKKCNAMKVDGKRSQSQIKNGDILLSLPGKNRLRRYPQNVRGSWLL